MYRYSICAGCKHDETSDDKTACCDCKRCYVDTDVEKTESLPDKYSSH